MAIIRCTDGDKAMFDKLLKSEKDKARKSGLPVPTQESMFGEIIKKVAKVRGVK